MSKMSTPNYSSFPCPYCFFALPEASTDGLNLVESGMITIEHETMLLKVYDSNSFNAIGMHQMPALSVELDSADCEISFARFRSARRNFHGGHICMEGKVKMDSICLTEKVNAKITLKMDMATYQQVRSLVASMFLN
jgi:hypothetical protein